MLRGFRDRFGAAGLALAIVALIVAIGGTALAASGALTAKQKKEVKKIAKSFQGTGPEGKQGPAGTNGTNGKDGINGAPGADGKSVTVTEIDLEEEECEERGGALLKQQGATVGTEVCNGAEGSPWTVGGTLPSGATETGMWSIDTPGSKIAGAVFSVLTDISFPIPLAAPLGEAEVHYLKFPPSEEELEPCDDGVGAPASFKDPEADPGELCVFQGEFSDGINPSVSPVISSGAFSPGALRSGATLIFSPSEEGKTVFATGTFAVTAP